jgi:putative protease
MSFQYVLCPDNFTFLKNEWEESIDKLSDFSYDEIVISVEGLGRIPNCKESEFLEFAQFVTDKLKKKIILEWDALLTEDEFSHSSQIILKLALILSENLKTDFSVRVHDKGALFWLLSENQTNFALMNAPIELLLESGSYNTRATLEWCQMIGKRLSKIILSYHLPLENLVNLTEVIGSKYPEVKFEILVLGKILLFHSPRSLLTPLTHQNENQTETPLVAPINAWAKSEESPHKDFLIHENDQGTFMFYPKDLNLLGLEEKLADAHIKWGRIDLRPTSNSGLMNALKDFRLMETSGRFRGFFYQNKTDANFKRLKNQYLNRFEELESQYLGDIIEVKKSAYSVLRLNDSSKKLRDNDKIVIKNPQGKIIEEHVFKVRNWLGENELQMDQKRKNNILIFNYIKGISVGSLIYLQPDPLIDLPNQ